MSEIESTQLNATIVAKSSESELTTSLQGYSTEEVSSLLDEIIEDKSRTRKERRKLVAQVVKNQPYETRKFNGHDKWNEDLRNRSQVVITFVLMAVALACGVMAYLYNGFSANPLWVIVIMYIPLMLLTKDNIIDDHEKVYQKRSRMTLGDFVSQKGGESEHV